MLSQTLTVYKVNKIQLYFPGCNKTEDYLPRQDFERQWSFERCLQTK